MLGMRFGVFDFGAEDLRGLFVVIAAIAGVALPSGIFRGLGAGSTLRRYQDKLYDTMYTKLLMSFQGPSGMSTIMYDKYTLKKKSVMPIMLFNCGITYFFGLGIFRDTYSAFVARPAYGIADYVRIVIPHLRTLLCAGASPVHPS